METLAAFVFNIELNFHVFEMNIFSSHIASLIVKKVTYGSFKLRFLKFVYLYLCGVVFFQALAIMEVVHGKDHVYVKELQKEISTHQK